MGGELEPIHAVLPLASRGDIARLGSGNMTKWRGSGAHQSGAARLLFSLDKFNWANDNRNSTTVQEMVAYRL